MCVCMRVCVCACVRAYVCLSVYLCACVYNMLHERVHNVLHERVYKVLQKRCRCCIYYVRMFAYMCVLERVCVHVCVCEEHLEGFVEHIKGLLEIP